MIVKIFLDVDDLNAISELEAYVDASDATLAFLSGSIDGDTQRSDYFASKNCLRE